MRHAATMVRVSVIDAYGGVLESHLARPRGADRDVFVTKHIGPTFFMDDSGFGHDSGVLVEGVDYG